MWFRFLSDFSDIDGFWFAWFSVCLVNGILYIPLTTLWPAANFGGLNTVRVMNIFAQTTLSGPFIAYWANLVALWYVIYRKPAENGSEFAESSDGNAHYFGYLLLSIANSVISFMTVEPIGIYYS